MQQELFTTLDELETRLSKTRFLVGDRLTGKYLQVGWQNRNGMPVQSLSLEESVFG